MPKDGLYTTMPWMARSGECPGMGWQIFAPCKIGTSAIRGGRMQQGAKDGGAANVQATVGGKVRI